VISWILFAGSAASLPFVFMVGSAKRWPWLALAALNLPWLVVGVTQQQWGFAALALMWGIVEIWNWMTFTKGEH
jgi:hypothetical protein